MKKLILSIILIFCFFTSTLCQSNYKDGYLITIGNDTLNGLIDFRTDHANSLVCKYKKDEKAAEKTYNPGEIAGYRFINEGKYYVSRTIVIDSLKRTVFLEFLVQGLLNLYYFPKGNGYYFFENKDGSLEALTKKADEIIDNSKFKVDDRFKSKLSYIFRDYLPLALNTSKAEYNKKSMIVLTKYYHDHMCKSGEKCIIFENDYKKNFTKFDFSAFSGFEFNDIQLNDINLPKMHSFYPIVGIGLNISSPRLIKSVSIMLDATLSKISGAFDFTNTYMKYSQYNFSGIKSNFSVGLEYIYPKGKLRPAINAGISHDYFFNLNSTLKTDSQISKNEILIQNSSKGIKTGLGVDYQIKGNQFITVRFLYSKHENYTNINNTYQLKLGYKL